MSKTKRRYNQTNNTTITENIASYVVNKRESFDHRFGDDLCEEILKYLSFADKIRFECVSKQWRRYIYCRQYVLDISEDKSGKSVNGLPSNKLLSYYDESITQLKNVSIIERVLQKCSQINEIKTNKELYWRDKGLYWDEFLRIIADNCSYLTSTTINVYHLMSDDTIKYFGEKCGKKLTTLNARYGCDSLLEYCPNLLSVNGVDLSDLIDANNKDKILVPKLQEIKRSSFGYQSNDLIDIFVDRYARTLKVFEVHFVGQYFNQISAQLSKLTKLETLKMSIFNISAVSLSSRFTQIFTSIGTNCVRIKHLSIAMTNFSKHVELHALLTAFNSFTELNSLDVDLTNYGYCKRNVSIKLIRNCTQLKRLTINSLIDDTFFADVDLYLPQLSNVAVVTKDSFSNVMINSLAKLRNLRAINVKSKSNAKITDSGVCGLIDNCPQFRSFTFNPCPLITAKTVKKLMEVAHNRPKINFNHIFYYTKEIKRVIAAVDNSSKDFASNLKIECIKFKAPRVNRGAWLPTAEIVQI